MTRQNRHEELHSNKVQTLNNSHTMLREKKKNNRRAEMKKLRNRVLVFLAGAFVIIGGLVSANLSLKERLAEKEIDKVEVAKQLETVTETQEMLKLQITKLEDDDYIAKLARKEYFLSEDGEIIFTIPNKEVNEEKEK